MAGGDDGQRRETQIADDASALPAIPASSIVEHDGGTEGDPPEPAYQPAENKKTRGSAAAAPAPTDADGARAPRMDWRVLRGTWPLFVSGLPALLTLIALAFSLFPWLEPTSPPEVRSVTITDVALWERNKELDDGRTVNTVVFEVETVGYDAEDIAVDWLVFDAVTRERLDEQTIPLRWGVIDIGTRSDRIVGEIEVPPPFDHVGCVFVRVVLQPHMVPGGTPVLVPTRLMLDVADTAAFDPYDATNATCTSSPVATREST